MEDFHGLTPQQQVNTIISSIEVLTWSRALRDDHMVVRINGFVVDFYRRKTSSEKAKKVTYAYRGTITFKYGPERKEFTVALPGEENRSLKALIVMNRAYIKSRLKQHFELPELKVQLNLRLAGWE